MRSVMRSYRPAFLIISTAMFVGFVWLFGNSQKLEPIWVVLPMLATLSALIAFDLFWLRLPHVLTSILLATGLVRAMAFLSPEDLPHYVIGAVLGWSVLSALGLYYVKVKQKTGIGGGDAMMLAGIGAWVGWGALPTVLLIASLAGGVHALVLIALRKVGPDSHSESKFRQATPDIAGPMLLPFGVHLGIALVVTLLNGSFVALPYQF